MMNVEELSNLLLHYGNILANQSFQSIRSERNECVIDNVTIRIISYNQKLFYHFMVNGTVLYCYELKA